MPDAPFFFLVTGVLLQWGAWAFRVFQPGVSRGLFYGLAAGPALAGSLLVIGYAAHDADFTLLCGQVLLSAAFVLTAPSFCPQGSRPERVENLRSIAR